jgi:hypothetical protein
MSRAACSPATMARMADRAGERRWPMALAVLVAGGLRTVLPAQLRAGESRWLVAVIVFALLAALILGDPGRIDRDAGWLTNVIAFALWYWDLDRGGAAARARGPGRAPAFVFPEMTNAPYVRPGWYPTFVDYLHLSFTAATAFSPTDVSAIRPWSKLMMMAQEAISLVVALLVVARAVNILK